MLVRDLFLHPPMQPWPDGLAQLCPPFTSPSGTFCDWHHVRERASGDYHHLCLTSAFYRGPHNYRGKYLHLKGVCPDGHVCMPWKIRTKKTVYMPERDDEMPTVVCVFLPGWYEGTNKRRKYSSDVASTSTATVSVPESGVRSLTVPTATAAAANDEDCSVSGSFLDLLLGVVAAASNEEAVAEQQVQTDPTVHEDTAAATTVPAVPDFIASSLEADLCWPSFFDAAPQKYRSRPPPDGRG